MGCTKHPDEGRVGVCGSCVSDRLGKELSSSDRRRFNKNRAEDPYLWKESTSTSSSVASRDGAARGGKIVNTIATLIKTDYTRPAEYEVALGRDMHREATLSRASEEIGRSFSGRQLRESRRKEVSANDGSIFDRKLTAKSRSGQEGVARKKREICEITPVEPEQGNVQTIHALMNAEPKSGRFSRSNSKGSPASTNYSRSGSRRQSWTVFWRSEKKEEADVWHGRSGRDMKPRDVENHSTTRSRSAFSVIDADYRDARPFFQSSFKGEQWNIQYGSRVNGKLSRGEDASSLESRAMASVEESCKGLADFDCMEREFTTPRRKPSTVASHSYERDRSWEQFGLTKLPFASAYVPPVKTFPESRRSIWNMVRKKSGSAARSDSKVDDYPSECRKHYPGTASQGYMDRCEDDSSDRPTPFSNSCFPQSGGKLNMRRDEAHIAHERLRHRRLSIYSYGLMSQPQLTVDSHLPTTGRSRGPRPYMYNGKQKDSCIPGERIAAHHWQDEDGFMSPFDHYVEVSRDGDLGANGIIDFIPISELPRRALDLERNTSEGFRSPPWSDRRVEPKQDWGESLASGSGEMSFLGKEELTTVFEQDSESGYGEDYIRAAHNEGSDSPDSCFFPTNRKLRQFKGKSIVTEIEEAGRGESHYDLHGEASYTGPALSSRSMSDSYARESTDSDITPARSSLRSLFYLDGDESHLHTGERRAFKPDDAFEVVDSGDWTPGSDHISETLDADHELSKDGLANRSSSTRLSPWKNFHMSPSMRKKFLWPRSSPQPHDMGRRTDSTHTAQLMSNAHHRTSSSLSDTEFHKPRQRSPSPTITHERSSIAISPQDAENTVGLVSPDVLQDEVNNGTSETVSSLIEMESSQKTSPLRESLSHNSSPMRPSLSRSSSKSPQITLSRCSSRRSRSSSWSSCLTDPTWSVHSMANRKRDDGSQDKEGAFSSLIRLGKKLSRRTSPNSSFNTSPWRSFSKGSPLRGETTR